MIIYVIFIIIIFIFITSWLSGNVLFHKLFQFLIEIFILIFFLLFIFFICYIHYWFFSEVNNSDDEQTTNIEKISYFDIIFSEGQNTEYLCREIDETIKNDGNLNFNKFDLNQLQFMLVCAKMKREIILRKLSNKTNTLYLGIGIFIIPFSRILFENYSNFLIHYNKYITETKVFSQFYHFITSFNEPIGTVIFIIVMYIILLMSISCMNSRETRFKLWIRGHKKINYLYQKSYMIGLIILLLGYFFYSLLSTDILNIIALMAGLGLIASSNPDRRLIQKYLATNDKIIIKLNKKIIFSEKNKRFITFDVN